jgi:hypothetical protein
MAKQSRAQLKTYFNTGDIPTEQHFVHLIDSMGTLADTNEANMILSGSDTITGSFHLTGSADVSQNITAGGNISATGIISSSGAISSGSLYINRLYIYTGSNESVRFIYPGSDLDASAKDKIYIGDAVKQINYIGTSSAVGHMFTAGDVQINDKTILGNGIASSTTINGHLTASYNISASGYITAATISASGTIYADNFTSVGNDTDGINFTDGVNITGNVTASGTITSTGHISSSNTLYGNLLNVNGAVIEGNTSTTGNIVANTGTGSFAQLESTKFIGSRPIVTLTSNQALTAASTGTYNRCGSHIITIPLNSSVAFDIGTEIEFIQTSSAGHLMVTASNGVTVNSRHLLFSASGQFSAISCKKVATNEWDIIGDLTA